jgi:hypothetical protein
LNPTLSAIFIFLDNLHVSGHERMAIYTALGDLATLRQTYCREKANNHPQRFVIPAHSIVPLEVIVEDNLEIIAAILAAGIVAQKSSMSPEKAVDEAITAYTQITARLLQLEAKQKQVKNAA